MCVHVLTHLRPHHRGEGAEQVMHSMATAQLVTAFAFARPVVTAAATAAVAPTTARPLSLR